jgi:DNA polymerase III delta subunit
VASGDRGTALRLLNDQQQRSTSSSTDFALYLVRMLARQIRILLRIHLGQEAGRTTAQIIADLKLPRYYAGRYVQQARRLPQSRLRETFDQLASFETALKSGQTDAATGLDVLVLELCSPAPAPAPAV